MTGVFLMGECRMCDQLNAASPFVGFAQSPNVVQLLQSNPWLIVVGLALLIPIVGIIFGTITDYLRRTRISEIEAALKRDMLDRGMTPEQIKMVVEASSTNKSKHMHGGCG
jgi:hypothetical protein